MRTLRLSLVVAAGMLLASSAFVLGGEEVRKQVGPSLQAEGRTAKKYFREVTEAEANKLTRIPSRPVPCPCCRHSVDMPEWSMERNNADADLCPHPDGRVRFLSDIVLCPYCGFAAKKQDFGRPLSPAVIAWVRRDLTPSVRAELRKLFDLRIRVSDEELAGYFRQETLPDTIRCDHAYRYYARSGSDAAELAWLAWEAAWAHRRALCDTIDGPQVMGSIRKVLAAVGDNTPGLEKGQEEQIARLTELYGNKKRFHLTDRMVLQVMLAGAYDRMGLTRFAGLCLGEVRRTVETVADEAAWMEGVDESVSETLRRATAAKRRQVFGAIAAERLRNLEEERRYLRLAAGHVETALRDGLYPPDRMATYVYLVGEFERRCENFGRALLWLRAAETMRGEEVRVEHMATEQLAIARDYMAQIGAPATGAYRGAERDRVFLTTLSNTVEAARDSRAMQPAGVAPVPFPEQ